MLLCPTAEPTRSPAVLVDELGAALDGVASRLQAHCLVEAEDGSVVGHALRDHAVPLPVVNAVLRRNAAAFTSSLHRQRSAGLLPGGPLLTAVLPEWDGSVHSAPLVRGGRRLGWLWLLGTTDVTVEMVAAAATEVAAACPTGGADETETCVRGALDGSRALPPELVGNAQHAWVVTVLGARPADVRLALSTGRRTSGLLLASDDDRLRMVLLGSAPADAEDVEDGIRHLAQGLSGALGTLLRVGFSQPVSAAAPLLAAAEQADAAAATCSAGRCAAVRDVRAQIVLEHARAALTHLPDLGPDPVQLLHEHDRRRGTDLAHTVRCWLDADGDISSAATRLTVHPNTLRYRLRCAQAVAGVSFEDLSVRLELHLRLR